MGLDNYWKLKDKKARHPVFKPKLRLIGGLCSDYGRKSFRGKCYSWMIERLTGMTLYTEKLSNKDVMVISKMLNLLTFERACRMLDLAEEDTQGKTSTLTKQEFKDLQRMFKKYGEMGASLEGWW